MDITELFVHSHLGRRPACWLSRLSRGLLFAFVTHKWRAKLPQPDDDNAKLGSEWFVDERERERERIEMKGDHI